MRGRFRMTGRAIALLWMAVLMAACRPEGLQPGDLLFQVGEGGMTDAIEAATDGTFSHVGILDDSPFGGVWEAVPGAGVRHVSLRQFLRESALDGGGRPMVSVYRVPSFSWQDVKKRVQALDGRPYDMAFLPGTEEIYCSELVYECYRDSLGAPLFETVPMRFSGADGRILEYWISHYEKLGLSVPEGKPGTNPNELSRTPFLERIPVAF